MKLIFEIFLIVKGWSTLNLLKKQRYVEEIDMYEFSQIFLFFFLAPVALIFSWRISSSPIDLAWLNRKILSL